MNTMDYIKLHNWVAQNRIQTKGGSLDDYLGTLSKAREGISWLA